MFAAVPDKNSNILVRARLLYLEAEVEFIFLLVSIEQLPGVLPQARSYFLGSSIRLLQARNLGEGGVQLLLRRSCWGPNFVGRSSCSPARNRGWRNSEENVKIQQKPASQQPSCPACHFCTFDQFCHQIRGPCFRFLKSGSQTWGPCFKVLLAAAGARRSWLVLWKSLEVVKRPPLLRASLLFFLSTADKHCHSIWNMNPWVVESLRSTVSRRRGSDLGVRKPRGRERWCGGVCNPTLLRPTCLPEPLWSGCLWFRSALRWTIKVLRGSAPTMHDHQTLARLSLY